MAENVYLIPAVSLNVYYKTFGATLFLGLAGIPLMLDHVEKKKALKDSILIFFWFAVPFLLAESYLFGIHLPYNRFIYFFATPITILSAVTIFYILTKVSYIPTIKSFSENRQNNL